MRSYHYVLYAGLFLSAVSAGATSALVKTVEALQEELPGVYPDPYYVINDPGYKSDVIKIALIRVPVRTGIDNKFSLLPGICTLLPIPVWNNGRFIYNSDGTHKGSRTDTPLDMLHSKTVTLVVENPEDVSDYDIVIRETYPKNSAGEESHSMLAFIYSRYKKKVPSIHVQVTSPVAGIDFSFDTEAMETDQLRFLLIPFKNKDGEKISRLSFTEKLYQEMVMKMRDSETAMIGRKRAYIFKKDPTLQQMEKELLAAIPDESCRDRMVQYKERMDYIEHMRYLAEIRDIARAPAARHGNRLVPAEGLLDVCYGRNFDLYHPALRVAMLETFDIRQQPVRELLALKEHFSSYLDPSDLQNLESLCMKNYRARFKL